MKDILQTLIELPTITNDHAMNRLALEYIEQFLQERGLWTERLEYNGVESLFAAPRPTKRPTVLLNAHLDVSPGSEDSFKLREEHSKLYGRGVFDMKFAIAAYLQLVDDIKDRLDEYDFGIMINTDEESGGYNGVKVLIEDGYIPTGVCIVPDGGDNWRMEAFAKGLWFLRVTTSGKAAHGSRPWEGENAFEKLTELLAELRQFFPHTSKEERTMTIGVVHAGREVNQIPDSASVDLDLRTTSLEEHQAVYAHVEQLCAKYDATLHVLSEGAPCTNDMSDPYLQQFAAAITDVCRLPAATTISFAGTDGRYFSAAGVRCAIVRPDGGGHHSENEWISVEGFYAFKDVLRNYFDRVAIRKEAHVHASTTR